MSFSESISNFAGRIFDEGFDEVLIFALIFIFIIISGHEDGSGDLDTNTGILPLVIIGAFLLLSFFFNRSENNI